MTSLLIGHGKLVFGDDGYYEGTFKDGEIEGHGYKVFGISKSTYTGQFHLGEMHGQGLMRKPNGEQYEGAWHKGKRQGMEYFVLLRQSQLGGSFQSLQNCASNA